MNMKLTITVDTKNNQEVIEALGLLTDLAVKGSAEAQPMETKPEPKKTTSRVRPKAEPKAETKPEPESKPEPKKTPPPAEETVVEVSLAQLKTAAKDASGRVGREKVLEAIKQYAPKLADVEASDYAALLTDLEVIGVA